MAENLVSSAELSAVSTLGREDLLYKLDGLLERYLDLLDQYERARRQLSDYLSSGFLSLAQANFSNTSRTRYGQDYYDERMQASTKVIIQEQDLSSFAISKSLSITSSATQSLNTSQLAKGSTLAPIDSQTSSQSSMPNGSTLSSITKPTDPIRWFGILVPQALRSTQKCFADAVEGPVLSLATLSKELRRLEIEIGRLRKQIKKM